MVSFRLGQVAGAIAQLHADAQSMHAMAAGLAPQSAALVQGRRVQRHRDPASGPAQPDRSAARG